MLTFVIASAVFAAMATESTAPEITKPPKGPAPRFVTVQRLDVEEGELVVSEECLAHPNVVSRTITKKEENRREEPIEIGSSITLKIHYYTTTHKLPFKRITLYKASGKKLPAKAMSRLKSGAMVLMSADGHPVEEECLVLINPETLVLVVEVEALPSPYESPKSTHGIIKELKK